MRARPLGGQTRPGGGRRCRGSVKAYIASMRTALVEWPQNTQCSRCGAPSGHRCQTAPLEDSAVLVPGVDAHSCFSISAIRMPPSIQGPAHREASRGAARHQRHLSLYLRHESVTQGAAVSVLAHTYAVPDLCTTRTSIPFYSASRGMLCRAGPVGVGVSVDSTPHRSADGLNARSTFVHSSSSQQSRPTDRPTRVRVGGRTSG